MKFRAFRDRLSLKSFLGDESGVTAIEMAFVGPPFFLVLMAMFETGLMLFTEYSLQAGVQAAGRMIKTGQAQVTQNWTAQKFKSFVCETATIVKGCTDKISVLVVSQAGSFGNLAAVLPETPLLIGPNKPGGKPTVSYNHGASQTFTAVYVTYDWEFHTPLMNPFSNRFDKTRRLVALTVFQNEPYN
jgi:Flp pilus assembly protein TadG